MRLRDVKVGMKVRVRDDARSKITGHMRLCWANRMTETLGKEGTVIGIDTGDDIIHVKFGSGAKRRYSASMLNKVEVVVMSKYKIGQVFVPVTGGYKYMLIAVEHNKIGFVNLMTGGHKVEYVTVNNITKITQAEFDAVQGLTKMRLVFNSIEDMVDGKQVKHKVVCVPVAKERVIESVHTTAEAFNKENPGFKFVRVQE